MEITMKKQPWLKFRAGDWLADIHLSMCSAEEKGVLIEMMAYAHLSSKYGYLTNGGMPIDDKMLANRLHINIDLMQKVLQRLHQMGRIGITDGSIYFIPSMVREHEKSTAAKFYGGLGGNPALVNGGDNPPLKTEQSREEQRRVGAFEVFWKEYPRKVSKQKALKAFIKQGCYGKLEDILTALAKQKQTQQWQDAQYIPHPTTWINNARWEDEVTQTKANRGPNI